MMEGTVNPDPQGCRACGFGPNRPRISTYVDRYTEETITEAQWCCSRCGSHFASGIISREPKKD